MEAIVQYRKLPSKIFLETLIKKQVWGCKSKQKLFWKLIDPAVQMPWVTGRLLLPCFIEPLLNVDLSEPVLGWLETHHQLLCLNYWGSTSLENFLSYYI